MYRTDWKHTISYLLLATFLLFRVANLHTVAHMVSGEAESGHCELCTLITTTNQTTPLQVAPAQETVSSIYLLGVSEEKSIATYSAPGQKTILSDYFHNKPPPFIFLG
ncbi:hypothetical protein [Maribacter sp. 2307ULW6-5]|uniref:hypothetical protein n=1 Tax=Maribacter sp. 2307ULW6-5 TaxID=3386275 RepID=UPI0039BD1977